MPLVLGCFPFPRKEKPYLAAVALANMLVDQSHFRQVVAIMHSPSVAAIANLHIVIQPMSSSQPNDNKRSRIVVKATAVSGAKRREEVARMDSEDMATKEAEIIAEALMRDGSKWRDEENNSTVVKFMQQHNVTKG